MATLEYLSIHYLKTCRIRHWVSQEVFLSPEYLILKVYATIANIGIDFVPSSYPTAGAFEGLNLPAAFLGDQAAALEGIMAFFRDIVDLDKNVSASPEERQAMRVLAERLLGQAIGYTLWGHTECYKKFTKPIMRDSMRIPSADLYCSARRKEFIYKDLELLDSQLKSFLKYLNSKLLVSKFFFPAGEAPSSVDIVLYAYLSVLLSVPDKFCPFFFAKSQDPETQEIVNRLRSFLLDFDDFLWHLNSQRADQIDMAGPIPSASRAALLNAELETCDTETSSEEGASEPADRPLLGSKERTQNIIFLSAAFAAMGAVMYSSRSS